MAKLESKFKRELKKDIVTRFPGAMIFNMDPQGQQGVADLLVLYKDKWAMLECKRNKSAPHRPNQDYYIDRFKEMSYGAFIFPENKEEVLNDLESTLFTRR